MAKVDAALAELEQREVEREEAEQVGRSLEDEIDQYRRMLFKILRYGECLCRTNINAPGIDVFVLPKRRRHLQDHHVYYGACPVLMAAGILGIRPKKVRTNPGESDE